RHSPRETQAPYRSFCDQDNASTADRLTQEATLAAGRFFLRRRAIDRCVLRDHGGFLHLELLRAVLATPAPSRPKHVPLCANAASSSFAPSLGQQLSLRFQPIGLRVARQSKSAPAFGNEIGPETNRVL